MLTLGLTGGIGSGKSTVAQMLADEGASLIDADAISRQSTQTGGSAIQALRDAFGEGILGKDGGLHREKMREIMLSDAQAKTRLEAIVHPIVGQQIAALTSAARDGGCSCLVLDIPLLVEGGVRWRARVDEVWVVDCETQTQIDRVSQRNHWPLAQIEAILVSQASRQKRLSCADAVIYNDGISLDQLRQQVRLLLQIQKKLSPRHFGL